MAGHFGRLQFGRARLEDAMRAGVIPQGMTPEQFMADPQAQQRVEAWHFADIDAQAKNMGLDRFIGQSVNGIPITQDAIRAMAHLGGIGGAAKFLTTGGQYNPSDAYGTSLADYATRHGGARSALPSQYAPQPTPTGLLTTPMAQPDPMQGLSPLERMLAAGGFAQDAKAAPIANIWNALSGKRGPVTAQGQSGLGGLLKMLGA